MSHDKKNIRRKIDELRYRNRRFDERGREQQRDGISFARLPISQAEVDKWNAIVVAFEAEDFMDHRYLQHTNNLSELTDPDAALGNLGLQVSLKNMTDHQISQYLALAPQTTVSATQWGYLGAMDQGVATTDEVGFAGLSVAGSATIGMNITIGKDAQVGENLSVGQHATFVQSLSSPGAQSRISGWQGNQDGNWDFRSIFADSLVVKAFTADVAQAFRGSRFLTKSFATIKENFTIPAVNGSATLTVAEVDGFPNLNVFEQNDFILLNIINQDEGLIVGEAWGEITSSITDNQDGTQSFTLTIRHLSVGQLEGLTANEGSEALSFGSANDPKGFIHDTVLDEMGSPYSQVVDWQDEPWDRGNWTLRWRHGILNGISALSGFGTDIAGVYTERFFGTESILIGDLSQQNQYLSYENGELVVRGRITVLGGNAATQQYADDVAGSAESAAKNHANSLDTSLREGLDDIFDDALTNGTTIIEGGTIVTSFIHTTELFSQNIEATGTITGMTINVQDGSLGLLDITPDGFSAVYDNNVRGMRLTREAFELTAHPGTGFDGIEAEIGLSASDTDRYKIGLYASARYFQDGTGFSDWNNKRAYFHPHGGGGQPLMPPSVDFIIEANRTIVDSPITIKGGSPQADKLLVATNSAGDAVWKTISEITGSESAVFTVFGREGNVIAESGDYSFSQISGSLANSQLPSHIERTRITLSGHNAPIEMHRDNGKWRFNIDGDTGRLSVYNIDNGQHWFTFNVDGNTGTLVAPQEKLHSSGYVRADSGIKIDTTEIISSSRVLSNVTASANIITSGTFSNSRISQSSVTQHESALTIAESQITGANFSNWDTAFAHTSLTNNPHSVTASQVGAPPTSRTLTMTAGTGMSITGGTQSLAANRTWTFNFDESYGDARYTRRAASLNTNGILTWGGSQAQTPSGLLWEDDTLKVPGGVSVTGQNHNYKTVGSGLAQNNPHIIVLGIPDDSTVTATIGKFFGVRRGSPHRGRFTVDVIFTGNDGAGGGGNQINWKVDQEHANASTIDIIEFDYDSEHYVGIRIGGTSSNWYPREWYFSGWTDSFDPFVINASQASNITPFTAEQNSVSHFGARRSQFYGDLRMGTNIVINSSRDAFLRDADLSGTLDVGDLTTISHSSYENHLRLVRGSLTVDISPTNTNDGGVSIGQSLGTETNRLNWTHNGNARQLFVGGTNVNNVIGEVYAASARLSDRLTVAGDGFVKTRFQRGSGAFELAITPDTNNLVFRPGGTTVGAIHEGEIRWGGTGPINLFLNEDRDIFTEDAFISGALDVTLDATFRDVVEFHDVLSSDDYVSGIFGQGWQLNPDVDGHSFFEIDNLRVRREFRTHIFRKDEVRATNGLLYVSDVSEVAEQKELTVGTGRTLLIRAGEGYASFSEGDELTVKALAPDLTTLNTVVMTVTNVDIDGQENELTVDVTSGGTVYEGDTIVRTSGGTLLLDSSTEFSPFLDILEDGNMFTRLGNLEGVSNASGTGLYGENTFLTGSLLVGDLTKAGQYLEYNGTSFTIITGSGNIDTVLGDLDTEIQANATAILNLDSDVDGRIATATADFVVSSEITSEIADAVDGLASESFVNSAVAGLALETYVDDEIASATADLYAQVTSDISSATAGLALESYVDDEISTAIADLYATVTSDISSATAGLALESYVDDEIALASASLFTAIEDVEGDVTAAELRLDAIEELGSIATLTADNFNFQSATDFWRTTDNQFQFGGENGIQFGITSYELPNQEIIDVENKLVFGSDSVFFGEVDVRSLPRVSDEGLVGLWRFDEGSGDTGINPYGNDAEIDTSQANYVQGISGTAIYVDTAGSSRIQVSHYAEASFDHTDSFTVSAWFKNDDLSESGVKAILMKGGTSDSYGLSILSDSLFCGVRAGSSTRQLTHPVNEGEVYHVAITYTPDVLILYVNGQEVSRRTDLNQGDFSNTSTWQMASRGGLGGSAVDWVGWVDECRVFSRELNANEIKSLYLHPSGNSGGLISTNQLVADQGFFQQIFSQDVDVTGTFTLAGDGKFVSDVLNFDKETFKLETSDMLIDSALQLIDIGSSHSLDGQNNEVSFANGVLEAGSNFVDLANFRAQGDRFWTSADSRYVGFRAPSFASTRTFFSGASDQFGTNASFFMTRDGVMTLRTRPGSPQTVAGINVEDKGFINLTGNSTFNFNLSEGNHIRGTRNVTLGQGTITASTSSDTVTGNGTNFNSLSSGHRLFDHNFNFIGRIEAVANDTELVLEENAAVNVSNNIYYHGNASSVQHFIDIASDVFDLHAGPLEIKSGTGIKVGVHELLNNQTFSFAGGILSGGISSVQMAGLTASATTLTKDTFLLTTEDSEFGALPDNRIIIQAGSSNRRFAVKDDEDNFVQMFMGGAGFQFRAVSDGVNRFLVDRNGATIGSVNVVDVLNILSGGELQGENWYIDEENWVHPSLDTSVGGLESAANFGFNPASATALDGTWTLETNDAQNQTFRTLYYKRYVHTYGTKKLRLKANARRSVLDGNPEKFELQFGIVGQSVEFVPVTTSFFQSYTIDFDVSGLTVGQGYTLQFNGLVVAEGDDWGELQVRGDFTINTVVE